jgi:hypothetical protein
VGTLSIVLALCLLAAPDFMTTVWPWPITTLLAQIYGAPFLAYGLGNLYAARQRSWSEARIAVAGTATFAVSVFVVSLIHRSLFDPGLPSVWLWFGGFALVGLALVLFVAVPALRAR